MEDQAQQCPGAARQPEVSSSLSRTVRDQMDFLQEIAGQGDISLDSLLYERIGDDICYHKSGEGPAASENSELEKVLDCILDTSASSQPHPWAEYIIPDLHGFSVTSAALSKTSSEPSADREEVRVWTEATATKTSIAPLVPQGEDRVSLENPTEDYLKADNGSCGDLISLDQSMTTERTFSNMSVLPGNMLHLPAQPRCVVDADGNDPGSSPPSLSKHLPRLTQTSCPKTDGKIKQEGCGVMLNPPDKNILFPDYGLQPSNPATPDSDLSLDYSCKPESAAVYENFRLAEHVIQVLPTSSNTHQNLYQPMRLDDYQQFTYQARTVKESFLPQIALPYAQYSRPDDPDQGSQFGFDSLPPKICLICGDEASGCHYGVLTCGSCKVFFKRAIEGQHNYLCAGRNDCIVDKIRRKNCPSCRLRKCCQAGMVLGGRKFKKFNRLKPGRELDAIVLQRPTSLPVSCQQALTQRISTGSAQEIQLIPELLQILQSIEPEVVYAGYDNTQPQTSSSLLCSLNQLCERQMLCVVKWSKSLPGFRNLHIDDQIILLQNSWMSLMVFAMGWRSYKHVSGQMLYFAPDLILNEQRMKESSFYTLCVSMRQLPEEFVKLQITHEEFLCMKALLLLNTIPLEGLKSQSHFDDMRSNYIRELAKAIGLRHKGVVASSQRFYQLTKVMDSMHELVKQLHLYCLNTFLQSRALSVEFPEMMTEVISAQLPKILAGMVKPLIFHKK
ncbi:progesterone receptor [Gastrophryne carolinensis]